MVWTVLTLLLAQAAVPSVQSVPASRCGEFKQQVEERVRFCKGDATPPDAVPIATIARRFAPVLWFSPDEPLLNVAAFDVTDKSSELKAIKERKSCPLPSTGLLDGVAVPHALPGDLPADGPVVYYHLNERKKSGEPSISKARDGVDLTRYSSLTLRYFFYYRCDAGVNGHVHDVESADLRVAVDSDGDCQTLRLEEITGYAHALRWLNNVLHLERDEPVRLPLTILVEEGKHASSPDRNGDGIFTPGYDVNRNVGEAWGVRDNFGAGLLTVRFSASDAKPRHRGHRVVPPTVADLEDPLSQYYLQCASPPEQAGSWGNVYELRFANQELEDKVDAVATIPGLQETHFGKPVAQDSRLADWVTRVKHHISIMARWDAPRETISESRGPKWPNELSVSWGEQLRKLPGALTVRGVFSLNGSDPFLKPMRADLLLTPTASRWVDTYVSLFGVQHDEKPQLLPEAGFRVRLTSKEPPLPLPFGLWKVFPMYGARVGLRLPSLRRVFDGNGIESVRGTRAVRLVFELGGGAF